ncbi:MAG: transporter substrate-binding domain-containing protein [Fibromonadaceae bacterium]|jgi:signal transduction histidine kinase/CheY-like chemotaxis protein/HPt (histidine-containing phosphotransfer) domain-containing protein|nr:transporter substrate-binding domain-containing protein [Fibromonadaceae bacterium]
MNKIKICILFMAVFLSAMLSACTESGKQSNKSLGFTSFRDVPGITKEEIKAIEALKEQNNAFVYASTLGTEAFIKEDGQIGGYIAMFCDWLTTLFGIQFVPEIHELGNLYDRLNSGKIDFAGITVAPQLADLYISSDPIANRTVKIMQIAGSQPLDVIATYRLPRYIFLEGSVTYADVSALLAPGSFEATFYDDYEIIYQMLLNDEADAFIAMGTAEGAFDHLGYVVSEHFFPLIFNPVTMTARNQEYEPIISVVTKALRNGGIQYLTHLYNLGYEKYLTHKLSLRLTPEERQYIKDNPVIKIGAQYYNYPIDFYNSHEKEWQGIMIDILNEISSLTGLTFEIVNSPNTEWPQIMQILENKEVSLVTQLGYTADRSERFLWPETILMREYFILISKSSLPRLKITEIMNARVGMIKDFSHTAMFQQWFPNHAYATVYDNFYDTFAALERGDIDVMMGSTIQLLALTNYYELTGYKANFIFDYNYNIYPGFNLDEAILISIMDKAFQIIDIKAISKHWMSMTFDYQVMLLRVQRPWLFGAIGLSLIVIVLISVFFVRSRNTGKKLEKLVVLRTGELQTRTEEALAASHSKSVFLAMMSHEIRTPMNSIMGFAELATDSDSMPQVDDYLKKITSSTRLLLRIVNDILDISKIEAGKMELESVPFDLHGIFSRCQSMILPGIKEKDLDLSIYAEPSIGKKLLGDPIRLYQVLMNLLTNAVKFTNNGIVKFSSAIKNSNDTHTTIYFEVKDTGIGISPEQIEKVFNPFTQVDSSATRNYEGTGLGLTIAKNIVELMDGKLTVESSLGAGSTFSFEITFNTIDVPNDASSQNRFDIIEKPHFEGLVLICDDNSLNQQVICAHLARVGLQTIAADNGKIGVELVQERKRKNEKPFDLILMDMFMPVMDGMEAAAKIIAMDTGSPIAAMTANVMTSELEKYKRNGMPDCLGKPFTSQELWQLLLKYLTPVSSEPISGNIDEYDDIIEQKKIMQLNFYKNNQAVHTEIAEAFATGDIKLAHRLAHTLKGSAGLLGKAALRSAALEVESLLKDGTASIWDNKMNILKTELMRTLEEFKPLLEETAKREKTVLNTEQTLALFEKLGPMLEKVNPECVDLLDTIRAVPGAEELAQQIENYNFKLAAKILVELKNKIGEMP